MCVLGYLHAASIIASVNVLPFPFRCSDDNPSASPRSVSLRHALWIGVGGSYIIFLRVILRRCASWRGATFSISVQCAHQCCCDITLHFMLKEISPPLSFYIIC